MESALLKVEYKNDDKEIFVTNYADCIAYDEDTRQLVMMHYGGYTETVRSMADAIYAGGGVKVYADNREYNLYSTPKSYTKTIKKDNPYSKCLIQRLDDQKTVDETNEEEQSSTFERAYIFTEQYDTEKLFKEVNKRTSIPMIPEYSEYVLEQMIDQGLLYKLKMLGTNYMMDGYCMLKDEEKIQSIVETGIKTNRLQIPGAKKGINGFLEIDGVSSYLKKFGTQIAEKIKTSFVPLFDLQNDKLSDGVQETDDYLYETRGIRLYEAQKAVAEAVKRKLEADKCGLIVAECGSGKSVISLTTLYALYKGKKEKTFNIILGPGHLGEKWVREIEWTYQNAVGRIAKNITDMNSFYSEYENGNKTMFVFLSKERARDGYMKKPAVLWNKRRRCFICPDCFSKQEMDLVDDGIKYTVDADASYYKTETADNHKCRNCGSVLWQPVNPDDRRYNQWTKITGFGWVFRDKMHDYYLKYWENENLINSLDTIRDTPGYIATASAYRKYAISTYIKKKMRNKVDTLIADELHLYKGETSQGESLNELVQCSKKVIAMTATLINGYSSGIFYILYRCLSGLMKKGGYDYHDQGQFNKEYGSFETTYEVKEAKFNAMGRGRTRKTKTKLLPGVSPLIFTRFFLQSCAFLSLSDMTSGMPEYEEIPIILELDKEVKAEYERIEKTLKKILTDERDIAKKILSDYLVLTTVYPDMPYGLKSLYDPRDGSLIIEPADIGNFDTYYAKEKKVLEIVKEKVAKGQRVLLYTSWVSTDTQLKLQKLLSSNGYRVKILKSTVAAEKREAWLMKTVDEGIDVLITNPSLVETGLDLNDFVNIIYFNLGYNLFTFRQSSRRSWRINQTADRVEVYLLAYENTMQHRAIRLMATKLAVASTIEGSNITDEGLAALGDVTDLTTALSRELAMGIGNDVEDVSALYKQMAIKNPNRVNRAEIQPITKQLDLVDMVETLPVDEAKQTQIRLQEESEKLKVLFKASKTKTKSKKCVEGQLDLFSMFKVA